MLALSSTSASVTWLRPREATRSSMRLRIKRRIRKGLRLMRRSASGSQVICCSDNPHLSLGVLVSEFYRRRILRSVAESTRRVVDQQLESQHNANVTFVFCRPGGYFAVGEEGTGSGVRSSRAPWGLGSGWCWATALVKTYDWRTEWFVPAPLPTVYEATDRAERLCLLLRGGGGRPPPPPPPPAACASRSPRHPQAMQAAPNDVSSQTGVMHLTTGLSLRL